MEMTFLEIGKKAVSPQFLENPLNVVNVSLAWVLGVDEDIIKVNNYKDIEFLGQDLINIALKAGRYIR